MMIIIIIIIKFFLSRIRKRLGYIVTLYSYKPNVGVFKLYRLRVSCNGIKTSG